MADNIVLKNEETNGEYIKGRPKVKYGEYTAQQAADEYFTEANKMLQGE